MWTVPRDVHALTGGQPLRHKILAKNCCAAIGNRKVIGGQLYVVIHWTLGTSLTSIWGNVYKKAFKDIQGGNEMFGYWMRSVTLFKRCFARSDSANFRSELSLNMHLGRECRGIRDAKICFLPILNMHNSGCRPRSPTWFPPAAAAAWSGTAPAPVPAASVCGSKAPPRSGVRGHKP